MSQEERDRERNRLMEDRVKWLRQERRQSYAALIDVGYQAAQLYLEAALRLFDRNDPDGAIELWRPLDTLRDTTSGKVADVELVGSPAVVSAAHGLRRAFRRAPDLLINSARRAKESTEPEEDSVGLSPRVRAIFGAVQHLVETAKRDLRIDYDDADTDAHDQDAAREPSIEPPAP